MAHKLRLILSALAVILGTAFMAAAFVGGDTIKQGFNELFSSVNENIDVQVTGKTDLATPETQNLITAVIPQSVADRLEHVPGAEKWRRRSSRRARE